MIPNNFLMNTVMSRLQQNNPQAYTQVQQWMNSGKDPNQIINEMLKSGQITNQQLNQAQRNS